MIKLWPTYIILICFLSAFKLNAQTDPCIARLNDAGTLINEGRYDEGIELLQSTLNQCKLSRNDQIAAYKELIRAYFEIDQLEKAEECVHNILKVNPKYRTDPLRDSKELINLFNKFRPTPVLRLALCGGLNLSIATAKKTYSVATSNEAEGLDNYNAVGGFQIGLNGEYRLWRSLWAGTGISYRNNKYNNTLNNIQGRDIHYSESLSYFDVPLFLSYSITHQKLGAHLQLGTQFSFLNSALGELSRDDFSDLVNRESQRVNFMVGVMTGIGLSYQHNALTLCLEGNYVNYPQLINKEGSRYQNLESIFRYYYLDNDFSIDLVQFNLSVRYPIVYRNIKSYK